MRTHYYLAKISRERSTNPKCFNLFVHFLKHKNNVLLKLCRKRWAEGTVHWNFHLFSSQIPEKPKSIIATCNRPYMSLENYLRTGYGEKSIYYEIS